MRKNNFKVLLTVMILTLSSAFAYAAPADVNAKTGINKKKLSIKVSEKYVLKLKGIKGKITWSSSKPKVAKVNKKGRITALKKGKATITAKIAGKKYKCKVTVNNNVPKDFDTPAPINPSPAPTPTQNPDDNISYLTYIAYNGFFNYKIAGIENNFIILERTDNSEVESLVSG